MKKFLLLTTVLASVVAANATIYTTNWSSGFANAGVVPDNNFSGWADSRNVTTMPAGTLQSVAVNLQLTGGWNGDLYAYLVHDSGFTVLLDRIGSGPFGDSHAGMNVTFVDDGTAFGATQGDINLYAGVPNQSGLWNPDNLGMGGGSLGSFLSTSPHGTWSLFIADLSVGGVTTVQSWGLQMDIVAVPEVETWIAAALAGAFGAFWVNRQIWSGAGSGSGHKQLNG